MSGLKQKRSNKNTFKMRPLNEVAVVLPPPPSYLSSPGPVNPHLDSVIRILEHDPELTRAVGFKLRLGEMVDFDGLVRNIDNEKILNFEELKRVLRKNLMRCPEVYPPKVGEQVKRGVPMEEIIEGRANRIRMAFDLLPHCEHFLDLVEQLCGAVELEGYGEGEVVISNVRKEKTFESIALD